MEREGGQRQGALGGRPSGGQLPEKQGAEVWEDGMGALGSWPEPEGGAGDLTSDPSHTASPQLCDLRPPKKGWRAGLWGSGRDQVWWWAL